MRVLGQPHLCRHGLFSGLLLAHGHHAGGLLEDLQSCKKTGQTDQRHGKPDGCRCRERLQQEETTPQHNEERKKGGKNFRDYHGSFPHFLDAFFYSQHCGSIHRIQHRGGCLGCLSLAGIYQLLPESVFVRVLQSLFSQGVPHVHWLQGLPAWGISRDGVITNQERG